jgi:cell division protein FtsL
VAGGILVVASLFGVVVCHAVLVSGQVGVDGLQQQVAEEQSRYQALRLEVAELEAPGRIVAEAQGRLGMVSPPEITYLTPVSDPGAPAPVDEAPEGTGASAPWAAVKPLLGGQG